MKFLASNFTHLQAHDEQLRRLGVLAERYFLEDPIKTSLERFLDFPVPVPPLAEQQEIVHRVEDLFSFADWIEARRACGKTPDLTPCLLSTHLIELIWRARTLSLVKFGPASKGSVKSHTSGKNTRTI